MLDLSRSGRAVRFVARLAMAVLPVALAPAAASAQRYQPAVSCEVADYSMTMRLYMPLTVGESGPEGAEPMQGSVEIHHQKVPKERRLWSLDGKRPSQFWFQGTELKLLLRLGAGPEAIVILIETVQRQGESDFTGTFRLTASDVKLTGRLACFAG